MTMEYSPPSPSPAPPSSPSASFTPNGMYAVPFVLSIISFVGSTIVLLTFASSKKLRTFLLQPVLLMILFDAFASIGNIFMFLPPMLNMQSINDWSPLSCSIVGAILGNMAQQCSILFYLSVVINMLITMTTGFGNGSTDDFRKFMSLAVRIETALVIVYCFLSTLYLYVIGAFGAVNSTSERYECWIKSDHGVYRLVLYVPLMLTMVAAAGSLLFIWLQGSRRMMPEAWRYTSRRIMLFVIVFLILWTIPTIFRMYELTNRNYHASDWLLITVKGLYGVNGLVNTFVWASSRPFVDVYRKSVWCQRCFCVENTTDNQNSSSTSSSHLLRASLSSSDLSAGMSSGRGSGSSGGRGSGSGGGRGSRGGRGNHLYSHDYQKYRGITSGSINVTDGDEYNLNEEVVDNDTTDGSSTVL